MEDNLNTKGGICLLLLFFALMALCLCGVVACAGAYWVGLSLDKLVF